MGMSSQSIVLVIASQYLSVEQEVTGRECRGSCILISYYALHNNIGMAMAMLIAHAQLAVVMTCTQDRAARTSGAAQLIYY